MRNTVLLEITMLLHNRTQLETWLSLNEVHCILHIHSSFKENLWNRNQRTKGEHFKATWMKEKFIHLIFSTDWCTSFFKWKWRHKHPRYKADPCYLLTRREQVTVFRLRTGHNRLNYHRYSKLRVGYTEQCPCGRPTGSQTREHLLQSCPIYEPLRKGIWPDHTPVARMLYGSLRDLRCTASFIEETGVSIWRTRRRRNESSIGTHTHTHAHTLVHIYTLCVVVSLTGPSRLQEVGRMKEQT